MGGHDDLLSVISSTVHAAAPRMRYDGSEASCLWRSPKRVALMHVGKAAGSTVVETLKAAPVNFTQFHILSWGQLNASDFDLFVVVTREPVSRTISAFNYNHPIGGSLDLNATNTIKDVAEAYPELADFTRCFSALPGGVNDWAEALSEDSDCGRAARKHAFDNEVYQNTQVLADVLTSAPPHLTVDMYPNRHVVFNHLWYMNNLHRGQEPSENVMGRVR